MRIGILGGTFNPIHNGHIYMGRCAKEELNLDSIMILPSGYSYMKKQSDILSGETRYIMADLAVANEPGFFVSEFELRMTGPTYTSVTFQKLLELHPDWEIYFIVGADTAYSIENWKDPEIILSLSNLVVLFRNDGERNREDLVNQCTHLKERYGTNIIILDAPAFDISSTTIREMIKKDEDISEFVPQALNDYIKENGLYK